ncbi:hypothetical protein TraAM80_06488 [Trypanosoma rangeli]|uniref:Uncharacterized protein n=1 Tax=Trypanosoma rangeli TaxID=5698 RepID=A0A422NA48_TRYRA|nr:uncharacterized protein TraAM80_06488 [Trypanosoma rangeli]RNF02302.1 hypothetical protein TraAM80_06488 [Trypanosoma rangeli]|eukprot:RNF02302.1 hypothetical protein TraAM80_06488 [Trypanosoma rangeli]
MDFFAMLNQRQLDQNSELRRLYRVSACYATAALVSLLLASVTLCTEVSSEMRKGAFWATVSSLVFLSFTIIAYTMMMRALNVLSTSRFILSPAYASPRFFPSAFFISLPQDVFTCRRRLLLVYAPLLLTLLCLYAGIVARSYSIYLCSLLLLVVCFCVLWSILSRMVNSARL